MRLKAKIRRCTSGASSFGDLSFFFPTRTRVFEIAREGSIVVTSFGIEGHDLENRPTLSKGRIGRRMYNTLGGYRIHPSEAKLSHGSIGFNGCLASLMGSQS
jgi:hypothetical protein